MTCLTVEYQFIAEENERWQRRNLSRIMAIAVILLAVVPRCVVPDQKSSRLSELPQMIEHPKISYTEPSWSNEHDDVYLLQFEATNLSDRDLEFVQIHASFYDKDPYV